MADIICANCNKIFDRHPNLNQKFCSVLCFHTWRRNKARRVIVFCTNCGLQFEKLESIAQNNKHHFCTRQCYVLYKSKTNSKIQSLYYGPDWNEKSRQARTRDKYICQICNATRANNNNRALTVHHIIPFSDFKYIPNVNNNYKEANNLQNLITVCLRCHRLIENNVTISEAKAMNLKPPEPNKDINTGDFECLICHRLFTNERAVYHHSKRVHNVRKDEYIIKFFGQPLCACGCGQPLPYNKARKRFNKYINGHNLQGQHHSEVTKVKMSQKRKQWWSNQAPP